MTALELVQDLTWLIFIAIAVATLLRATHRPTPSNVDVGLLFGITTFIIVESSVVTALGITPNAWTNDLNSGLVMLLPFFLLRLADDFAGVGRRVRAAGTSAIALSIAALVAYAPPRPLLATALVGAVFVVVTLYAALVFLRNLERTHGVTRRRMTAIALGSAFLGAVILVATVGAIDPAVTGLEQILTNGLALATAVSYYVGFAPPRVLRRAWQEPELRSFLTRAAELPRLGTTEEIVREIERGAAAATGGDASLGLWDERAGVLRFTQRGAAGTFGVRPPNLIAGRIFEMQRPMFVLDAARGDPENAEVYRKRHVRIVVGAPITAGTRRLGVLTAFSERAPVFTQDDLELVQLLADQAAVVLESRALIDEAARVRAHEEATRLKEDFLSAAAHDLRTPLTTIIGQAQALERRARRDPALGAEVGGIQRLVRESVRLRELVAELLDASRLERGQLVGPFAPTDVGRLVADVARRQVAEQRPLEVRAEPGLVTYCDAHRIDQVVTNLLENAMKFSPPESELEVRAWRDGDQGIRVSVSDHGIGIPATDLPHIFDRFRRGSNVDDRRFAGMGLGLYISRGIVEQHGGRIWVESQVGEGTTFHVALPSTPVVERAEVMN